MFFPNAEILKIGNNKWALLIEGRDTEFFKSKFGASVRLRFLRKWKAEQVKEGG